MPLLSGVRRPLLVLLSALVIGLGLVAPAQAATVGTSVSVSVQTPESLVIDVTGTGFSTAQPGVYLGLAERGITATAADLVGTAYVMPSAMNEDGGFTTALSLDADDIAELDPTKNYAVHTVKAHNIPDPGNTQSSATDVTLDFAALGLITKAEPSVSVSQTEVSAQGETVVTVEGTGFDPSAVPSAARPPLNGSSGGVYVVFGKFAENWSPAAGAASSTRVNSSQKWAVLAKDMATIGGPAAGAVELKADGSFTAEVTVDKAAIDAKATADSLVNYGIYTYPGGGAKNADFETYTPITFVDPKPSVSVSQTEVAADGQTVVTVEGTGFDPSAVPSAARPPLNGSSGGVYVVFGKFAENWSPAAGAASSTRVNSSQKWAVLAKDMATIGGPAAGAVELKADGSFTAEVTVDKAAIDAKATADSLVNYGIYTYPGGGAKNADFETYTPITFTTPEPATSDLTWGVKKSFVDYVSGQGTVTLDEGLTKGSAGYVWPFAATAERGNDYTGSITFTAHGGVLDITLSDPRIRATSPTSGVLSVSVDKDGSTKRVDVATVDLSTPLAIPFSSKVSFASAPVTLLPAGVTVFGDFYQAGDALDGVTFSIAASALDFGDGEPTPTPTPTTPTPTTPTPSTEAPKPEKKGAGYLTWGVKQSFRQYLTSGTASGKITLSGGASLSGSVYRFGQSSTNADENGVGTTSYRGSVNFYAHGGVMDLTFSNPAVVVKSSSAADLMVTAKGKRITMATLDLSRASVSRSGGSVVVKNAPARITSAGKGAFNGYAADYTTMDPVTFAIGSDSAGGGATVVAAAANDESGWTPPAEPPATTGVELEDAPEDGFAPGDVIAASASGFAPGEVGVRAVVYSDPIVLATNLTADSAGRVEWKGTIPSTLEPGEHTLTFQGSVSRGVTFTVAEKKLEGYCAVSDATMEWGFKEAFRAYISSSIAKGDWSTKEPATYETPRWTFPGAGGEVAPDLAAGTVELAGGIAFTGHEGELDTRIDDPKITFLDEDSAVMVLDFSTTDREKAEAGKELELVTTKDVEFLRLDLSEATIERDGQQVTMTGIPAVLTAQGDSAFPTYVEGDEFDPIDLSFTVAADCAADAADETVQATAEATAEADDEGGSNALWWGLGGLGALALLGAGIWIGRRGASA